MGKVNVMSKRGFKNRRGYVPRRVKRVRNGKQETTTVWVRETPRAAVSSSTIDRPAAPSTAPLAAAAAVSSPTETAYEKFQKNGEAAPAPELLLPSVLAETLNKLGSKNPENHVLAEGIMIHHIPTVLEEGHINGGPVYREGSLYVSSDGEYTLYEARYNDVPDPQWQWDEDETVLVTRDPAEMAEMIQSRYYEYLPDEKPAVSDLSADSPWSAGSHYGYFGDGSETDAPF